MASYEELIELLDDNELRNKVMFACLIKADALGQDTPSPADNKWIAAIAKNPTDIAEQVFRLLLAANNTAPKASIAGAGDAAIQAKVDLIVPILVNAMSGA